MRALLREKPELDFATVGRLLDQAGWKPQQQVELLSVTFDLVEETPGLTKGNRSVIRNLRPRALDSVRQQSKDLELEL